MTDTSASTPTLDDQGPAGEDLSDHGLPQQRDCTRCDGAQHLVVADQGMGKYLCDTCGLVVGFDLEADRSEFLINRGAASHYTKDVFGRQLLGAERRIN